MKVPKTEIIARLRAAKYADAGSTGPLSAQLANQEGGLPAKDLWQRSGFAIEAFYQQLKTEMSRGWIVEPEPATVREVRED